MSTETRDIWAMLEEPAPQGCEGVQDLYSWSLNYDAGKGPFPLFLDLIGWSADNFGETLTSDVVRKMAFWIYPKALVEDANPRFAYQASKPSPAEKLDTGGRDKDGDDD